MAIQSIGVGSGIDLEGLVTQLLEAERAGPTARLDAREEQNEARLSAIGSLISRVSDFQDSVESVKENFDQDTRSSSINHPGFTAEESETAGPFSVDSVSNSATEGQYEIAIEQLAQGSRIETADAIGGGFSASSDSVTGADGSLTFKVGGTGDSFTINVTAGTTLLQLRNAINADSNNFGVNASLINTGTADGGVRLVFTSDVTGTGNDLVIVNNGDIADLQRVSTTDSAEAATFLAPVLNAQNARATIDGIAVESTSNKFENTIENVSFEASSVSERNAADTEFLTSSLNIGFDQDAIETRLREFVDNYNELISEVDRQTRIGESDLEEDGALAGDFLVRGLRSGLANILSSAVPSSNLGSIFAVGLEFTDDGKLEIPATDFGVGSGVERLEAALDDNFDDIASLFADETDGIAVRLEEFLEEYTRFGGLLRSRESNFREERDNIFDEREALDLRLLNTEQILRDRYVNLDLTVARLNSTGNALLASLSAL